MKFSLKRTVVIHFCSIQKVAVAGNCFFKLLCFSCKNVFSQVLQLQACVQFFIINYQLARQQLKHASWPHPVGNIFIYTFCLLSKPQKAHNYRHDILPRVYHCHYGTHC